MSDSEKQHIWEDAMAEFSRSLKLMHKKFVALDTKITDLSSLTDHFHIGTEKLEKQLLKEIEKRAEYFQNHDMVTDKKRD